MAIITNQSLQGVRELNELLELTERNLKDVSKAQKKLVKDLDLTTAKGHKVLNEELKTAALREKELIQIENEKVKLLKTEEQLLQAKNRTQTQVRKEQERTIKIEKKLIQEAKKLNDIYARESRELTKLSREFKNLVLAGRGAEKETIALGNKVKVLRNRIVSADKAVGDFRREVGQYKNALAGSLGTVGQFATKAGAIGAAVLIAGTALRSTIGIIVGFEQANANLQAVLGATSEEMQSLIEQAKQLGASTSFSASQVTGLQTEFAKLGFPTKDIQLMAASTLDAANAMGSDLAEQAKLTGATLRSFGLDASETQRVNDVLAKSTSASALDFQKLASSMSTIAPVAASFGFSLEGTTALLGELSNAGFDASSAATATRNILLNLADSNGKLAKSLKEPVKDLPSLVRGLKDLESQGIDLGEALELTDKRSVAAFSTFLKGTDSVLALNDTLLQAGGTAEQMANIQLATLEGSVKILNSAWEGLVLSMEDTIGSSEFLSITIKSLTGLLSFLSGATEEVKKSQSELNNENLETIRTTRQSIQENEVLADRYEELTDKVELNADERQELNSITRDLIARFGESVAIINQETGALEINIAAIRKKILADKILESETSKTLLTEKARLETQIELANQANETLDNLSKTFQGTFSVTDNLLLKLIDSAKRGNLEYAKTLREIRIGFIKTGEDTTEFDNKLSAIETTLFKTAKAVGSLTDNQIELNKINEEFKSLGIDIDDLLTQETNNLNKNTGATKTNKDARKELVGLIEKQKEAIRKLQEQRDKSNDEQEIAFLNERIKTRQKELKLLTDSLIKIEKIQKRETELAEDSIKIQKAKGKTTEDILKEEADAEAERIKKQKERIRELAKALDKGAEAQRKAHQERLSQFDEESAASKKLQDSLAEDARRGVADAEENLVFARQRERDATLERIEEVNRQKRIEEGLVFLKLLASNAGNPNVKQPVLTSIAQHTAARLFISTLAGFYDGTDNVGKSLGAPVLPGKDGHIVRIDSDESIWSKKDNAEMNNRSREEIKDLAHLGEQYKLGKLNDVTKKHKELHIASSYMSNDQMLNKMDELIESTNNAHKKIKTTQITAGDVIDIAREVIKEEGKTTINVYKKGGLFG